MILLGLINVPKPNLSKIYSDQNLGCARNRARSHDKIFVMISNPELNMCPFTKNVYFSNIIFHH